LTNLYILTLCFLVCFTSCNTGNEINSHAKNKTAALENDFIDSLDNNNPSKGNKYHQDSAYLTIEHLNDSLWKYINESISSTTTTKHFPNQQFYNKLVDEGFDIDTTDNYFYSLKRLFNKRLSIQFSLKNTDTIITYIKISYEGEKYDRVFAKWSKKY
jgi:hypothetical protein